MKLPVWLSDLHLQGLFFWHRHLWVKNDPHFCGHGTVSAPPDLGAHSISWCIAPARDYAVLSGAEEEMFRETDVPVSAARLSLLLPSMSPRWLVNYHSDVRSGPAPVPSSLALAANEELHMLQRRRSPGLICIGWMEIKRFTVEAKLVNTGGVNTLNTHAPTAAKCHMPKGWLRGKRIKYLLPHKWRKWCRGILCVAPLKPKNDDIISFLRTCIFQIYKERSWTTAKENMHGKEKQMIWFGYV